MVHILFVPWTVRTLVGKTTVLEQHRYSLNKQHTCTGGVPIRNLAPSWTIRTVRHLYRI